MLYAAHCALDEIMIIKQIVFYSHYKTNVTSHHA